MKKASVIMSFFVILFLLQGCGMSNSDIAETVQQSMQETLNQDPDFQQYRLDVTRVDVMKESGNSYRGHAYINFRGNEHRVRVDILVDGREVMWEAPPGSFLFIAQEELRGIFQ